MFLFEWTLGKLDSLDLRDEWMVSLCFFWRVSFLLWKERVQQIVDPECNYPRFLKQPGLVTGAAEPLR